MNALATEYQDVFQLYLKLGREFTKIMKDGANNPQTSFDCILTNHDYLIRIEQLNSRILRLFEDWEVCRKNIDPQMQDEVRKLAWAAKAQAVQLKKLCSICAQKLQEV